jgi:hypothetical protein
MPNTVDFRADTDGLTDWNVDIKPSFLSVLKNTIKKSIKMYFAIKIE